MAANTLAGFGFRGGSLIGGASSNLAMTTGQIAYNDTVDIGFGDPVLQNSSGYIAGTATTFSTGGMLGIFRGCYYADSSAPGGLRFSMSWPGVALASSATVVTAFIEVDVSGVYLAQYQGTALAVTNIGCNIDVVTGTASAPNTAGISTCLLDATGALSTTALPFRIVGILGIGQYANAIAPTPSGVTTDDNGWLYVKINNSSMFSTTTGT